MSETHIISSPFLMTKSFYQIILCTSTNFKVLFFLIMQLRVAKYIFLIIYLFTLQKKSRKQIPQSVCRTFYSLYLCIFNPLLNPFGKTHLTKNYRLANTLSHHSVCNFFKSCDISTSYIIAFFAVTFCSIIQIVEDINHDVL